MLADIIRRYQSFNPDTGRFDSPRLLPEYAELLGVSAGRPGSRAGLASRWGR